jgi:uncharacterized RmlC-like cupin family protein
MLRVSKTDGWPPRAHDAGVGRQDLRSSGGCVVIRSGGCLPGGSPPVPAGLPRSESPGQAAATQDCRRSGAGPPGGSGPSSGGQTLRLHLVMIPPGTRGMPHLHPGHETVGYVVSGEAEVWHGAGLVRRSVVRAGDFIYIPPGTPHLAVNRGDVISIAVVACPPRESTACESTACESTACESTACESTAHEGTVREGTAREDSGRGDQVGSVTVELPRHLAGLLSYPVGYGG